MVGESGEEFRSPGGEGAAEPVDLRDRAAAGGGDGFFGGGAAGVAVGVGVSGDDLLGDQPGGGDLAGWVAGIERCGDPCSLPIAESVGAAAQQPAGAEQWFGGECAVSQGVLLDPAANLIDAGQR